MAATTRVPAQHIRQQLVSVLLMEQLRGVAKSAGVSFGLAPAGAAS